jgi:DNA-binding NarL/FixJ family response regulator
MDIHMPGMDGVAATAAIHTRWPAIRVIMLTAARDQALVAATIQAGARGYILKDAPTAEAVWAIRGVMVGASIITPASLIPLGPMRLPLEDGDNALAGDVESLSRRDH